MKESLYSQGKPIFRETLNSEQDTRRNGGTPTNVTFSNGVLNITNVASYVEYKKPLTSGYKTIIFRGINITDDIGANHKFLLDNRVGLSADLQIVILTTKTFLVQNVTDSKIYINGNYIGTTGATFSNFGQKIDLVFTFNNTKTSTLINLFSDYAKTRSLAQATCDSVEIYNYAWTASQVANDYNNSTYKDVRDGLVLDIDSRHGVIEDKMGETITNTAVTLRRNGSFYSQNYNGTTSNLNLGNILNFQSGGNDLPLTFTAWIKTNKGSCAILCKDTNTAIGDYGFYTDANGYISLVLRDGIKYLAIRSNSQKAIDGQLHFVCATYDGLKSVSGIKLYQDGILITSTVDLSSLPYTGMKATSSKLKIGERELFSNVFANGQQEQQRIYNRVLSANEISQLYTSQKIYYV